MAVSIAHSFFLENEIIGKVFVLNLLVGLGLFTTLWLHNLGVPFLVTLFGAVGLFLPAFNLALTFEQLTEQREKLSTILLWTTIFTLTLTPAVIFLIGRVIFNTSSVLAPLGPLGVWWVLTAAGLFIVSRIKKVTPGFLDARLARKDTREAFVLLVVFLVVMLVNFMLYRFIPEADSYSYLLKLEQAQSVPAILAAEPRILFLVLTSLFAKLLAVDPYWVLKVILPLFYFVVVGTVYLVAKPLIKQPSLRILAGLSPLLSPIVLQEALISRPQTILVLVLIPILYLLRKISAEEKNLRQLYWLGVVVAIGVLGLKIHALFLFLIMLGLIAVAIVVWPYAKKRPLYTLLTFELIALVTLPTLITGRISYGIEYWMRLVGNALREGQFDIWFIDSYRNIDGAQLSWPGWSALLYYGYNVGLFVPAVLLLAAISGELRALRPIWQQYWPIGLVLALFFVIAEILPRFQLAFLPDRAWLFIALSLAMLIPHLLTLVMRFIPPRMIGLLFAAGILSLIAGSGLTYAKQGWVSSQEYEAVTFIRQNTPAHAVFIGPSGLQVVMSYFAERILVTPDQEAFFGDDPRLVEKFVEKDRNAVYIIYSENRFDSLYTQREWWKTMNFYGANVDKFSNVYPIVYNRGGVTVWEVKK